MAEYYGRTWWAHTFHLPCNSCPSRLFHLSAPSTANCVGRMSQHEYAQGDSHCGGVADFFKLQICYLLKHCYRFDDGWDDGSDGVLCRLFAEDTVGTPGLAKLKYFPLKSIVSESLL